MLRCRADPSDDDDVWVDNEACVDDGDIVNVVRQEGEFMLVRTKDGDEGYIRCGYVHKSTTSAHVPEESTRRPLNHPEPDQIADVQ
jgi:hypothetical protein